MFWRCRANECSHVQRLRHTHLAAGGVDVRRLTRRRLLQMGAPIRAARTARTARAKVVARRNSQHSLFLRWAGKQFSKERTHAGKCVGQPVRDRQQYRQMLKDLKAEWLALPEWRRNVEQELDQVGQATGMTYEERVGKKLWECSCEDSPISKHLIEQVMQEVAPSTTRTRGATAALEPLRAAFAAGRVVKDKGQIPVKEQLPVRRPCHMLHPGVCQKTLADDMRSASQALQRACATWAPGTPFRLEAQLPDGGVRFFYKVKAVSDKDVLVLAQCCHSGPGLELLVTDIHGWNFEVSEKTFHHIWTTCPAVQELHVLRLPLCKPTTLEEARHPLPRADLRAAGGSPEAIRLWSKLEPGQTAGDERALISRAPSAASSGPNFQALQLLRRSQGTAAASAVAGDDDDGKQSEDSENEEAIEKLEQALGAKLIQKHRRQAATQRKRQLKRKITKKTGGASSNNQGSWRTTPCPCRLLIRSPWWPHCLIPFMATIDGNH